MQNILDGVEPARLWQYFLELSKIPRGSKNEAAAAAWVAEQGRALGCKVEQDAVGNVLIRKPGTPGRENRPGVCLQAHVDMVCEKNEGTAHDFLKDPLPIYRDGDLLRARGTTLGADNGIGVASALAVLATPGLEHGPLEVLVTIDEETGLTGANNLGSGWLRAKYLLNLDSEEEGYLTIGCAGGIDTVATRAMTFSPAPVAAHGWRLRVLGLRGGHSGIDIAAGRANAIRLLAQVLSSIREQAGFCLGSVQGGNKRNAIPREASAVIVLKSGREEAVQSAVERHLAHWRAAFGAFEPGLMFSLEPHPLVPIMSLEDAKAVLGALMTFPHGVEAMSPDIPGLVQTSTNLGVVTTYEDRVEANLLTRSSIFGSRGALTERIAAVCALAGFKAEHVGGYPGWKPEPGASVVRTIDEVQKRLFGKPMHVMAIHAGLECGLIGEKYPEMEMASIGPDMKDVHTPDEQVSIPSVGRFFQLLVAVLAEL